MKICHITSMHDWNDDRIYQRACLGLAREGLEVHLVATRPKELPVNTEVNFHWIKQRIGWKRRWYSSKEAIEKAIRVKADIYHFHDPDLLPHIVKLKNRVPYSRIVYDIHENYTARFGQWKYTKAFSTFFVKKFRNYELKIISKIAGYTVTTQSMHELFKSTNKPWLEIRNTVDISRIKDIDLNKESKFVNPTVYTSGTNSDARNVMETVQALPLIIEEYPSVNMMFVGKYQDDLKNRINDFRIDFNLGARLIAEGMLPWKENFKRTAKAFCGCVFYENNVNNKVTLPNRLYEYMYCGLPVVATDFPELRKVINDTNCGILIDSDDPKAIAEGFIFLLNNPEEAKKMGERGKKAIEEKYGYHVDLKNTINLYKELI